MPHWVVRMMVVLTLVPALSAPAASAAAPGSVDGRHPFGVEPFPRATIVEYQRDDEVRPRRVILGRVDRMRREMQVDDQVLVEGTLETVTYRIPEGTSVDAVAAHYQDVLGGEVLFRCEGRDCGRSNDWANQVFEQAILYGPDRNQRYLVLEWQERLVAVYVVERGNRRVYAHLEFVVPEDEAGLEPNALLTRRMEELGWAPVDGAVPAGDGSFDAGARTVLAGLSPHLDDLAGARVVLVCHLYGPGPVAEVMTAADRCARRAVAHIEAGAEEAGGTPLPRLTPFAAGPMLPRGDRGARLELVVPGRLEQRLGRP